MELSGSLLELTQDVFFIYDGLDESCTLLNPDLACTLGLEKFSPYSGSISFPELQKSMKNWPEGDVRTRQEAFSGTDGKVRILEIREKIHKRLPDRTPWQILGSARDVSDFSALVNRERHLKSLISSLEEGLVEQDESGAIVFANAAAEQILGISFDQMRGRSSTDPRWQAIREDGSPFPGDDHPAMVTLRTGENQNNVIMGIKKPDGHLTWISISTTLVKMFPSEVTTSSANKGVIASFSDITSRKIEDIQKTLAQKMSEISKESSANVFTKWFVNQAEKLSGSNVAFFQEISPGPLGHFPTVWSESTENHFCTAEPPEIHHVPDKGGLWTQATSGDRPLIHNDFPGIPGTRNLPTGHPPLFRELLIPVKDGSDTVGVLGVGNKRTDYLQEDGIILMEFANTFWQHIKERRTYETLLQMEAGLESSPNGYAFANLEGLITYVNPAFLSLWGYSSVTQVYGRKASTFWSDTEKAEEVTEIVLKEGLWRGELSAMGMHGAQRILDTFAQILKDRKGAPFGIMATFVDVTRNRIMDENARQLQHLESLGVLAGGIAHDFNNLMGGIYGCIDMAALTQDGVQRQSYLTQALNTMGRAKELTRQLLTFSNGGEPLKTPSDLFKLAKSVVEFTLSGTAVKAEFNLPHHSFTCSFDENQLSQVIRNITLNALQAMPEGGKLEVRGYSSEGVQMPGLNPGPWIVLEIEDHGKGIPAEDLLKIFDPFFTTKDTGTGLGLSTAYSIIRKHHGSLTAASLPGQGAVFRICLPAPVPETSIELQTAKPKAQGRILILDDEQMLLQVCGAMVRELGFDPCCVSTCREAVEEWKSAYLSGNPFQGAILDLTIPGESGGVDTARQFKSITPDIPLFVSSGYSGDPVLSNPTEYGFTASLQKPYSMVQLATVLKTQR